MNEPHWRSCLIVTEYMIKGIWAQLWQIPKSFRQDSCPHVIIQWPTHCKLKRLHIDSFSKCNDFTHIIKQMDSFIFPTAEAMQSFFKCDWESSKKHLHLLEDSAAGGGLFRQQSEGGALIYIWTRGRNHHLDLCTSFYICRCYDIIVSSLSQLTGCDVFSSL